MADAGKQETSRNGNLASPGKLRRLAVEKGHLARSPVRKLLPGESVPGKESGGQGNDR